MCQYFTIFGQNSQIMCKNHEKLENILSIYICWWTGTNVCTVVLHSITENIGCMLQIWIGQEFPILGQNIQILYKNREKSEILAASIFVGAFALNFIA